MRKGEYNGTSIYIHICYHSHRHLHRHRHLHHHHNHHHYHHPIILYDSGVLDTKMAPKAVTLREESELQAMMERLALEQEEVDGDTPEDS